MSKHHSSKIGLAVVLVFSLTSCATIKENLGFEPPEMSSTAMGAATGTAIGATAGAIIGSTSGNTGEGLILGGGLGAVSGAVVGSELGERDQEYASHQNTLDRQAQEIKLQNRNLDKLRGSSFDSSKFDNNGRFVIPSQNRSSRGGYAYQKGLNNSYASVSRTTVTSAPINSYAANNNDQVANQLRARLTPSKPSTMSLPQTKTVLASGGETVSNQLPKSATASTAVTEKKVENTLATNSVQASNTLKSADTLKSTAAKTSDTIKSGDLKALDTKAALDNKAPEVKKTQAVAKAVTDTKSEDSNGGSCSEAESEANRARTAASDTDKIFYYRRALRLCKTKPNYHVEMGKVYSAIGRKEEAEFEFSKALEIDPDNRDAQDELTLLMLDSGN